jgi:hypothetical protein
MQIYMHTFKFTQKREMIRPGSLVSESGSRIGTKKQNVAQYEPFVFARECYISVDDPNHPTKYTLPVTPFTDSFVIALPVAKIVWRETLSSFPGCALARSGA